MKPKIAIIGAGPAGLVFAISLARRGLACVVYESMDSPLELQTYNPNRSYAIDITGHGLKAIRYIDAVDAFDNALIQFNGLKLNGKTMSEWTEPGWIGSRGDIVSVLTRIALDQHSDYIDIRFQSPLEKIDVHEGTFTVQDPAAGQSTQHGPFDLVVAADGGGSRIREQAQEQEPDYVLKRRQIPFFLKMLSLDRNTAGLDPHYLQVLSKKLLMVAGAINGPAGKNETLWFSAVPYSEDHRYASIDEVKKDLATRCPEVLNYCSDSALSAFADLPAQNIGRITSSTQLWAGKVAFLGDAAISYPPIGQGINGAMESAMVLDQAVAEFSAGSVDMDAAVRHALQEFNARWLPETRAIAWIGSKANQASRWHVLRGIVLAMFGFSPMDLIKSSSLSYAEAMNKTRRLGPLWWG